MGKASCVANSGIKAGVLNEWLCRRPRQVAGKARQEGQQAGRRWQAVFFRTSCPSGIQVVGKEIKNRRQVE